MQSGTLWKPQRTSGLLNNFAHNLTFHAHLFYTFLKIILSKLYYLGVTRLCLVVRKYSVDNVELNSV